MAERIEEALNLTKEQLEALLLEGLRSPVHPVTDEMWTELEQQIRSHIPELNESRIVGH